jgi:uncharacterized iron-regulated protein
MIAMLLMAALAQHPDTAMTENWVPHRVYDARHKRFSDFESLAAAAARADVVFFGEHHDDSPTHRMELALLQAVARRRGNVVLALEMFERDVQPILDQYLAGRIGEAAFLTASRPWPNYQADYRPLIEFARAHGWKVVAGNVPRRLASAVSSQGLDAINRIADSTRRWAAAEFRCPEDDYFRRFKSAMGEHPMGPGQAPSADELTAMTARFYQAQCVKDETMAESVARAARDASRPLVIHYNGDFHSDFGEGTAERTRRRLPGASIVIVTAVPVESLDAPDAKAMRKQGDWLLFTLKAASFTSPARP